MAEVRVTHFIALLVVIALIGIPVLAFFGFISIGWLNKESMTKALDQTLATATGYTAAKSPTEAMDHFRDAIQNRKYKYAANYCTKNYADLLNRGHPGAAEVGADIDKIRTFGKNGGLMTDKVTIALYRLDPFPMNFKVGPTPVEKGGKAYGSFAWDPVFLKNPVAQAQLEKEVKLMDPVMYSNVLTWKGIFTDKVELVKEGEEWKLNVPTDAFWDNSVKAFDDKYKTYHTGLNSLISGMTRERYADKAMFEGNIIEQLKKASQ